MQPRHRIVAEGAPQIGELVAGGTDVVVIVVEGERPAARPAGPGRVAVIVGDPADERVRSAAAAMGAELFGE